MLKIKSLSALRSFRSIPSGRNALQALNKQTARSFSERAVAFLRQLSLEHGATIGLGQKCRNALKLLILGIFRIFWKIPKGQKMP
jgi:hypothetical protein